MVKLKNKLKYIQENQVPVYKYSELDFSLDAPEFKKHYLEDTLINYGMFAVDMEKNPIDTEEWLPHFRYIMESGLADNKTLRRVICFINTAGKDVKEFYSRLLDTELKLYVDMLKLSGDL